MSSACGAFPQAYFQEGGRIEAGFRKYVHRADPPKPDEAFPERETIDVLVCHGNVIRYFLCRALQFPPDAWLRFGIRNGSISVLTMRPSGRVSVSVVGETGHMPPDKITSN